MSANVDVIREEMQRARNVSETPAGFESDKFEDRILGMVKSPESETDFSFEDPEDVDITNSDNVITSYLVGDSIPVEYVPVDEVVIDEIHDKHGKLSEKVQAIMDEVNCSVIPFEAAGILPQVVDFQKHDLVVLNNTRYIMSRDIRSDVVAEFKQKIIDTLESGLPYTKCLTIDIFVGTQSYASLMLSRAEWSYLCSMFKNYNALIIQNAEGQLTLKVG